jgi:hypothetical protein
MAQHGQVFRLKSRGADGRAVCGRPTIASTGRGRGGRRSAVSAAERRRSRRWGQLSGGSDPVTGRDADTGGARRRVPRWTSTARSVVQTVNRNMRFAGRSSKPSDGLEPSTPSDPRPGSNVLHGGCFPAGARNRLWLPDVVPLRCGEASWVVGPFGRRRLSRLRLVSGLR